MNSQSGKIVRAVGLMSGTSCDGIDAAIVDTDGKRVTGLGAGHYREYRNDERAIIRQALDDAQAWQPDLPSPASFGEAERMVTHAHGEAVELLLDAAGLAPSDIDIVGFHGQTVLHRPLDQLTVQLGDGKQLAQRLGIPVVFDFRSADVKAGGEGAPFAPLYHLALVRQMAPDQPVVVINAGGVGNVTWISPGGDILAFDTGPANGPLDDWVMKHTGSSYDKGGALAKAGRADEGRIKSALTHEFFNKPPPKSLDRQDFTAALAEGLSPEDGAATLIAFSAAAIAAAGRHFPEPVSQAIVCGGGRHNPAFMTELESRLGIRVETAETVGWRGDMIEAEAFGLLAVRHLRGLPLSLPTTTGVPRPMSGGRLAEPV